jgi:hypothetical protein
MFKRMITCMIAGLVCGFCLFRIGKRFMVDWLPMPVLLLLAAGILIISITYGVHWEFQRRQAAGRSAAILAFWQGLIRYGIAMDLSMIGFQKLFHLQFSTHLGALDLPFSSFSPEDLTWAFFGQSRAFVCVIGGLQILGSFLLVFNRTRLVGIFVLLPVVLNIVLLNACYHFDWGESIQALELLLALLYLLFSEYGRLVEFFFRARSGVAGIRMRSPLLKNGVRLSVVFVPLLLIAHYGPPDKNPWLTGKYRVGHLRINQRDTAVHSCADSILTTVYFDQGNECLFEYNGQQRRVYGIYRLDAGKNKMTVLWHYPKNVHDTLVATLTASGGGAGRGSGDGAGTQSWIIAGKMGKDSVEMTLLQTR